MDEWTQIADRIKIERNNEFFFVDFLGNEEMVELLLENGAKVDATDVGGYTPLIRAAWFGSYYYRNDWREC